MTTSARRARVRAPELAGRGWLNTAGRDLRLADLRGKIVLLDFWTFCCVNCLHVLDELRPLEARFADVLVTIGVHSPKFVHEADPQAVAAAVERYAVRHPVLDDPTLRSWDAYAAKAWPTLVVVDPQGYVVAHLSGEGHAHGLVTLIEELVAEHEAKGTLHHGDGPYVAPPPPATALRFPGAVVALPGGTLLASDTAHHQLVELEADLETERRRIGDGTRGLVDGASGMARFSEPQGLAVLPADVAARAGYDVVVADSVNHALRAVRLADGRVSTLAGTGRQLRTRVLPGEPVPAAAQPLSTPWDVAWWRGAVVVAMAGSHQLWSYDADARTVRALAGTTNEGLVDGDLDTAWFAQPSGLAVDGDVLWVADAETSALRRVAGEPPQVTTAIGQGLFDFGHRDGAGPDALLQHPLGIAVLPDGSVAIADTYNGAVRRYAPATGAVSTLASGLAEPSALLVEPAAGLVEPAAGLVEPAAGLVEPAAGLVEPAAGLVEPAAGLVEPAAGLVEPAAGLVEPAEPVGPTAPGEPARPGTLVVVESAAHRLTRVPIPAAAQRVDSGAHRTRRPVTDVAPGAVRLAVAFVPPTGQKLDDRYGDPTRLTVSASPPELLTSGAGAAPGLVRALELDPRVGEGVLHVSVQAAACDDIEGSDGERRQSAACHLYQQDWGIPLRVVPAGVATVRLDLRGV